jgi:formiminotetrahydrofolate cyclodeaminase
MGWFKLGKKGYEMVSPKIAKNLSTKRSIQDKVVEAIDKGTKEGLKGVTPSPHLKQSTSKSKKVESKKLKSFSYKYDDIVSKHKKNLKETKNLIKASGAAATAAAGAAGVSLYNKKKK